MFVVDDDNDVREGLKALLDSVDIRCEVFSSTREFLQRKLSDEPSCLILDVRLPGASGLDLQRELADAQIKIPIIFISGHGDIPMTVKAMQAGAVGFFTKPIHEQDCSIQSMSPWSATARGVNKSAFCWSCELATRRSVPGSGKSWRW